jgi:hypothetical protein
MALEEIPTESHPEGVTAGDIISLTASKTPLGMLPGVTPSLIPWDIILVNVPGWVDEVIATGGRISLAQDIDDIIWDYVTELREDRINNGFEDFPNLWSPQNVYDAVMRLAHQIKTDNAQILRAVYDPVFKPTFAVRWLPPEDNTEQVFVTVKSGNRKMRKAIAVKAWKGAVPY